MLKKLKEWFGKLTGQPSEASLLETLEEIIEDEVEEDAKLRDQEKKLLANVLQMREMTVDDVMVRRADIIAASIDTSAKELLQLYSKSGFSRLPIYGETLDDVQGYLDVRNLLPLITDGKEDAWPEKVREVLFVPESMLLIDLLLQMRVTRISMAIVVDEYGGVNGLVTDWNALQELLGDEEASESYEDSNQVTRLSDGSAIVSARMELEDFEDTFGQILTNEERKEEEIDTVGGLITSSAGYVPGRKEIIKHPSGFEFEILEADPRRVIRVRVYNKGQHKGEFDAS